MTWFTHTILNKRVIIPVFVVLIVLSSVVLPRMIVKKNPSVTFPIVRISGHIPHFSKEQLTNALVYPLMNQLRHDIRIKESQIYVGDGSLFVELEYFHGSDTDEVVWGLKSMMTRLKSQLQLPSTTQFSYYHKDIESRITPFIVGVTWSEDDVGVGSHIPDLHHIISQFQHIDGVKLVRSDFNDRRVMVTLDSDKMAAYQVRLLDVSQALQRLGQVSESFITRASGHQIVFSQEAKSHTIDDLRALSIKPYHGQPLRLGDIASVVFDDDDQRGVLQIDDEPGCLLGIYLYPNATVVDVHDRIMVLIERLNEVPGYPNLMMIHNQSAEVSTFVRDFKWNIIWGAVLILVSLLILTTLKMGLLTAIMLPLTSLFSMTVMVLMGVQVQQVSLAGFIIALGLVVDNAIVLQEVYAVQPHRFNSVTRIYRSVRQVFPSILVSTITTLMAFAPVFFIKSEEGLFMRSLPISIWINLSVAFVLAVTLLPFLLYYWPSHWKLKLPSIAPLFHGPFQVRYIQLLRYCFKRPIAVLFVIGIAVVVTVFSTRMITLELMPSKHNPMFYINLTNTNQSNRIVRDQLDAVMSVLRDDPDVVRVVSAAGRSIPRLDLSFDEIGGSPGNGQILVYTRDDVSKQRLIDVIKDLIPTLPHTPKTLLASLTYSEVFEYPIRVNLYGVTHQLLLEEAAKVTAIFNRWSGVDHAQIAGLDDVSLIDYQPRRQFQYSQGVLDQELDLWMSVLLSPMIVGQFKSQGLYYPIQLTVPQYYSFYEGLSRTMILNQFGQKHPLSSFLMSEFVPRSPSIVFNDFLATVSILVKPAGMEELAALQSKVDAYLQSYKAPYGIRVGIAGKLGKQREVLGSFAIYSIAIVFLMYAILVIRFRSFTQPFLIYVTIPLSFIGSIIGLVLSGQSLTFIGILGLTGLTGIVINDGILLVDTANALIRNGSPVNYAIIRAAKSRFFPVVLTSLTTIIGLMPLLLSENMFSQLALTFVSGLFSSTVLLLFIVPVLYQRLMR